VLLVGFTFYFSKKMLETYRKHSRYLAIRDCPKKDLDLHEVEHIKELYTHPALKSLVVGNKVQLRDSFEAENNIVPLDTEVPLELVDPVPLNGYGIDHKRSDSPFFNVDGP
jgi:hypothetical protein